MSGTGAFEGLEGIFSPGEDESYEPGKAGGYRRELTDWIAEDWLGRRFLGFGNEGMDRKVLVQLYESLIGPIEDLDHDQFLDAVVASVWSHTPEESSMRAAMALYLLDPLLQALYNLGRNGFTLLLPPSLEEPRGYHLATGLKGKKGRPLEVTVRTPLVQMLGCGAEYCKITLHGDSKHPGSGGAQHSEFICNGEVEEVGWYPAEHCTYYVRSAASINAGGVRVKQCTFYVSEHVSDGDVERLRQGTFFFSGEKKGFLFRSFMRNNRLFEPDGSGDWQEVLP